MLLRGECSGVKESLYFPLPGNGSGGGGAKSAIQSASAVNILTITATLLGLVLNILSLVIFLRVFNKSSSGRSSSFHLFLVFLSALEISFCLASAVTYANVIRSKSGVFKWRDYDLNSDDFGGSANTSQYEFRYSLYIPTESSLAASVYYNLVVVLFAYLAVVTQFARNSWVATTALLRCYVATRRTNVQISQIYSIRRISLLFAGQLMTVVTLSLIRTCVNHKSNIFNFNVHSCNISNWDHKGTLLVHVTRDQERERRTVNMAWTVLSQVIPLIAIITSSILLVNSLRTNSMIDSSERNKKITRMVFIFSLAFALLEMPRALVFFLTNFLLKRLLSPTLIMNAYQASYVLSLADSTVNVFIYFFNDQHFKKELCASHCCDDSEPCWRPKVPQRRETRETTGREGKFDDEDRGDADGRDDTGHPLTESQIETTV